MKSLVFLLLVYVPFSFATAVFEFKDVTVVSNQPSEYEARKELEQKAVRQVIRKQIRTIAGKNVYKEKNDVINKKILSKTKNIVTSVVEKNVTYAIPTSTGQYDINISQKTLLNLMRKNGFFASLSKKSVVLPLVAVEDKVNFKNYFWWGGDNPFFTKVGKPLIRSLHRQLYKQLKLTGGQVLMPIQKRLVNAVDSEQKFLNLKSADHIKLAEKFGADTVLLGKIIIQKDSQQQNTYVLRYDIQALDMQSFKITGFVKKDYVSLPGSFKASTYQVFKESKAEATTQLLASINESKNLGVVGAKTFLIKLKGDLKYKQYSQLKNDLKVNIGAVNSLTEKEFKPGSIVLELSSPSQIDNVAKKLSQSKFGSLKVEVSKDSDQSIVLDVK